MTKQASKLPHILLLLLLSVLCKWSWSWRRDCCVPGAPPSRTHLFEKSWEEQEDKQEDDDDDDDDCWW